MDITELIRGIEITETGWSGREAEIQEDFMWGIGPEALYQMTRAEYKTEPDKIAVNLLVSKFMTTIMDTKLRDKLMKEKKLELKKTIKVIKQNTCEKKTEKTPYRKL